MSLQLLCESRKVGYVFSGGSSRCAFQVGVIETLSRLGVKPGLAIGVSAGAWNAAIVAARIESRARDYWRWWLRLPHVRLRNLLDNDHSPWRFREMHERTFRRFIGDRLRSPEALQLFISVTRLRDGANVLFDAREFDDPLRLLLAANFLMPFYTHAPMLHGERYGDGSFSDNAPYEKAFASGCDAVVLVSQKGESEGGLFKNRIDVEHVIPPEYRDRIVVIRPRHRLPVSFTEKRWEIIAPLINLGALRTREVLLGEDHPETHVRAKGEAPSAKITRLVQGVRRARAIIAGKL